MRYIYIYIFKALIQLVIIIIRRPSFRALEITILTTPKPSTSTIILLVLLETFASLQAMKERIFPREKNFPGGSLRGIVPRPPRDFIGAGRSWGSWSWSGKGQGYDITTNWAEKNIGRAINQAYCIPKIARWLKVITLAKVIPQLSK